MRNGPELEVGQFWSVDITPAQGSGNFDDGHPIWLVAPNDVVKSVWGYEGSRTISWDDMETSTFLWTYLFTLRLTVP